MDRSPASSSVHGILQARIPEWVAISFSRGSSLPRDQTHISYVSCIGRWVLYHWCHLGSKVSTLGQKGCVLPSVIGERSEKILSHFIIFFLFLFLQAPLGNLSWSLSSELHKPGSISLLWHVPEGPALWPRLGEAGASLIWAMWFPCQRFTVSLAFTFLCSLPPAFLSGFLFSGTEKREKRTTL